MSVTHFNLDPQAREWPCKGLGWEVSLHGHNPKAFIAGCLGKDLAWGKDLEEKALR